MRAPACTFSNVTSYTGSPFAKGWPMPVSSSVAMGRMSIVWIDAPIASARAMAFDFVRSLVAKPGIV